MQIIYNDSTNPFFNLAAEEYLTDNTDGDIFMLWRNDRTVVIGKNQNAWAEVNVPFAEERHVSVVRRLTGGGAVFHDLGNVNFTFITDADCDGIDFARFSAPVIRYLKKFGVDAVLGGRNDILAGGRKISGNAQCVRQRSDGKKRLIHHGTLLYSADLSDMSGVLNVNRAKLATKGISSVKSRVVNIRELSPEFENVSPTDFVDALLRFAEEEYKTATRILTQEENAGIEALKTEKYATWEWNFGSSPSFSDERTERFPFGTLTVMFSADNGIISDIALYGDFFGTKDVSELAASLRGLRMDRETVRDRLESVNTDAYISGCAADDLVSLIFGDASGSDGK